MKRQKKWMLLLFPVDAAVDEDREAMKERTFVPLIYCPLLAFQPSHMPREALPVSIDPQVEVPALLGSLETMRPDSVQSSMSQGTGSHAGPVISVSSILRCTILVHAAVQERRATRPTGMSEEPALTSAWLLLPRDC